MCQNAETKADKEQQSAQFLRHMHEGKDSHQEVHEGSQGIASRASLQGQDL